ncbi:MAG: CBS domain-containing protein [Candidatus Kapaibacterium sp.]
MKAKDILLKKGPEVITIGDRKTLGEALRVLVNNNIGVLPVLSTEGKFIGILSERDILRKAASTPDTFMNTLVSDVMTKRIIYADYDDDIDYIESIMTLNKVRHLPIMKDKIITGLISIGDVVKASLSDKKYENKYLLDYIAGSVK